jgi:hypothetical protein
MIFRSREAARVFQLRGRLFSQAACDSLLEDRHHVGHGFESENIFSGFRDEAREFFRTRQIKWHGEGCCDTSDRVAIYRPQLGLAGSQIVLGPTAFEDLFFEPFDQIMRLQLLASAMERSREMDADVVSVLHIAPRSNDGLMNVEFSRRVGPGSSIGEVWKAVAAPDRFKSVATEDLIPLLTESGVGPAWADYVRSRYGAMA